MLAVGPDGMLYVGLGDGGSGGDPAGHGQDRTTLLGSLLRIDPDGDGFSVPDDNPFVDVGGGVREEIYAFGLRNPWRFSFDRATGDLWLGDVGQSSREEINIVESGDNLGWRLYEGDREFNNPDDLPASMFTGPILDYTHSTGWSVTGGYVYRGSAVPSLQGVYVYGDYGSGTIWGLVLAGDEVLSNSELGNVSSVASFGEDESGELYAVSLGGTIWRFEASDRAPAPSEAPDLLSDTGVFTDLSTLTVSRGFIEYDLSHAEWADGARLRRWIVLPGTSRISFAATGAWEFPLGTVIVKHFDLDLSATTTRRLETRVMVKRSQAWDFYLYKWNEAGTDANLLVQGSEETLTVTDPQTGEEREQVWTYPSTAQCAGCHSLAADTVLGIHTRQLNRNFPYSSALDNQLRAWNHIGLFAPDIGSHLSYDAWPALDDVTASIARRARVYLDVNCSMCHQPGGLAPSDIDLRFETSLANTNLVDVLPDAGDLGLEGARRIHPGDREASVLWERQRRLDDTHMPPLSDAVDGPGLDLIGDWIDEGPAS